MREDVEQIKQRIPLLEYLQRRNWTGCRIGGREEFVGLCPLHADTRPSFYVNARKNLFYCHGCQRGGDLIRFGELSRHLSFRESLACLVQDLSAVTESDLLARTIAFFQLQLHRYSEAVAYLQQRGLHDPDLIAELGLGYAPGGNLRRHLTDLELRVLQLPQRNVNWALAHRPGLQSSHSCVGRLPTTAPIIDQVRDKLVHRSNRIARPTERDREKPPQSTRSARPGRTRLGGGSRRLATR